VRAGAKADGDTLPRGEKLSPVYAMALSAEKREDEVKLSGAMAKLRDEDPSVAMEQNAETHQTLLWGQGEIHLQVALDRLRHKYHLPLTTRRPRVAYKEAIRRATSVHGRHKRQSGGHGQFGDVHLDIKPLPRGSGFVFEDQIVGGVVPRQFIPAVEEGVREYLVKGPLGFPVVDVWVALTDGQYHAVDSSEMAFKTAGRIAMTEGMAKCDPVLLEPIFVADIVVPTEFTSKVHSLVSGRRGQILGYEPRPDWSGWDRISAQIPQSELHDLIIELRSLSQGVGTYAARFERLQELTGRLADQVLQAYKEAS
jgi:elongation factor G